MPLIEINILTELFWLYAAHKSYIYRCFDSIVCADKQDYYHNRDYYLTISISISISSQTVNSTLYHAKMT